MNSKSRRYKKKFVAFLEEVKNFHKFCQLYIDSSSSSCLVAFYLIFDGTSPHLLSFVCYLFLSTFLLNVLKKGDYLQVILFRR
jgi:hypothetical protein